MKFALIMSVLVAIFALTITTTEARGETVPTAPRNLSSDNVTASTVEIKWGVPSSDGGANINAYIILRRDLRRESAMIGVAVVSGNKRTYTDTGLRHSTRYAYRVQARNIIGRSPRSSYINVDTERRSNNSGTYYRPRPNNQACNANNRSTWVSHYSSFSRPGYTYHGCDVNRSFDTSHGPERTPRHRVLRCTGWPPSCGWRNG